MRKIFFSMVLIVVSLFGDVRYTNIFDAYDVAKEEDKPLLVMLSKKECPACQYMNNVVFKDKEISSYINKNFIAVEIDVYDEAVPEELEYFATPTLYFQDGDEKILRRINGVQKQEEMLSALKSVLEEYKK